ncbi:MAG: exosortase-associated EpsI family protein [Armatimonadetes bacterium]|nr:exosortase-associated EpsI family protein [Armatimonadota bacterium]
MESLIKRSYIFGGICLLAGAGVFALPKLPTTMDESKMEALAPSKVGPFYFEQSAEDKGCTYRMDARTYRLLNPYGIVARVYSYRNESYDVVLIAGNDKENFHDPRICFQGQGWLIDQEAQIQIKTKGGENILATIVKIRQPDQNRANLAIYFYRGKNAYYPSTSGLGMLMVKGLLKGELNTDIVFYRFMPLGSAANVSQEQLVNFVSDYIDSAHKSSGGVF